MRKLLITILVIIFFIIGSFTGAFLTVLKYGTSTETKTMNIGITLPLKAEQISYNLREFFNIWEARLKILSELEISKEEICKVIINSDPVNIKKIAIIDSLDTLFYPGNEFIKIPDDSLKFYISYNPFIFGYSGRRKIYIEMSKIVLEKKIAQVIMASSATPFYVELLQGSNIIYSSEDISNNNIIDTVLFNSDTGSIWNDSIPSLYWKKINLEGNSYIIIIKYKKL